MPAVVTYFQKGLGPHHFFNFLCIPYAMQYINVTSKFARQVYKLQWIVIPDGIKQELCQTPNRLSTCIHNMLLKCHMVPYYDSNENASMAPLIIIQCLDVPPIIKTNGTILWFLTAYEYIKYAYFSCSSFVNLQSIQNRHLH